jgi:hypothetical protein
MLVTGVGFMPNSTLRQTLPFRLPLRMLDERPNSELNSYQRRETATDDSFFSHNLATNSDA